MDTVDSVELKPSWLDRPLSSIIPKPTIEHLLIFLIIIAAIITRFYHVGLRVMSHDEVNHVVPSYELYQGNGYSHDPVTHGPLQFHMLAASYFLFGDSDFSSRIPAALFSIATIIFVMFGFKRYLGKTGALLAGLFFLISPYMLFYGRYTRNEAFVALFGVVMLYAVLRYLESGKHSNLYLFTAVLALHFTTKETSFIYTAQLLIFLAILFIRDVTQKVWKNPSQRDVFILVTMAALLFIGVALGSGVMGADGGSDQPVVDAAVTASNMPAILHTVMLVSLGLSVVSLLAAAVLLIKGLGWHTVKNIRSFDLLILTATMVLPQLIAFPINILGWDPLDYSQPGLIRTSLFLLGAVIVSLGLGLLWKPWLWLGNIALFYAIFTVFYTTFFTNGQGFFTGMVGSLGYWLSQQGVNRGSQPWYFFAFLQVPMYEYLPALGTLMAFFIALKHKLFSTIPGISPASQISPQALPVQLAIPATDDADVPVDENPKKLPVLAFLLYWSVLSLIAYTIAGEKMPWLTVHISLPMILCAAFGIGYLIDTTQFSKLRSARGALAILLVPVFLVSLGALLSFIAGPEKPFAGNELAQLQTTSTFMFALLSLVFSGWGLYRLLRSWDSQAILKILITGLFTILVVLTARSAFQASYINYDTAKEFLVYAHAARGPKDVLEQVEEISKRTTQGKNIKVAYIGDALYPYWWYFRDYPNKVWLKDELTRDLLNYPVIISDDEQYSKTLAILKDGYIDTKYMRLVWPMQDYFNMTWQRLWDGIKNPQMLQAIYNIWLNKDYRLYASVANNSGLTLETWQPSGNIHLFIRKNIVADIWTYGTLPAQSESVVTDPYEGKYVTLTPDQFHGTTGTADGQFTMPRGIAFGPDGSYYVADSHNHRIQKFSADGEFLISWGAYASVDKGAAPGGTFNEPWGIAVAPDGSVYVADTWNYRVQKFSADGKFISMWGVPGPAESPIMYWGPRGIAVDRDGLVYITDTGNNRVVVFDDQGEFLTQFGVNGINPGEFDEPVGIAVDKDGLVYVADTWNQRIQVFEPITPNTFQFLREWTLSAWFGQSVNNKPFLTLDETGSIFVTDPDAFRVLQFNTIGDFIRGWGDASSGIDGFGSPSGVAVDGEGKVWITDAENNYVLKFTLPPASISDLSELSDLPIIPEGLSYNPDTGFLESILDQPVYQLSLDGTEWVPLIPEGISGLFEPGIQPSKDVDGNWVILAEDGTQVFMWDSQMTLWISTNPNPIQ